MGYTLRETRELAALVEGTLSLHQTIQDLMNEIEAEHGEIQSPDCEQEQGETPIEFLENNAKCLQKIEKYARELGHLCYETREKYSLAVFQVQAREENERWAADNKRWQEDHPPFAGDIK